MKSSKVVHLLSLAVLVLALAAGAFGPASPVEAAPALEGTTTEASATVATGRLNVRTGPGVNYTIVTRIDLGQSMTLTGRNLSATWVRIRLPNSIEGWVSARYIQASIPIADLVVTSTTSPTPAPTPTAVVTVSQLQLRAGPGASYNLLATLGQNQALALLGRTADSAWVKVRAANVGEGWMPARVSVRLPGNENETAVMTFQTTAQLSSLPVAANSAPRVSLSNARVKGAAPVYITIENFPANRDVAAVLTSPKVPNGFVIATGRTDANGYAQLFFRMPDMWPDGAAITESDLSLAVGTLDGAVLIWNGLTFLG
ncbi:MAG: SH3 domain-containing protein [Anaerolineales bacterium]|nr:SH3 domain-containing protein [Anaerolineales bacterium]